MKHYGHETISVGDIRKAIEGLSDDLPACVLLWDENYDVQPGDYCRYILKAGYEPPSGISNAEFMIQTSEGYSY